MQNPNKIAIISDDNSYSYQDLQNASEQFARVLLDKESDLLETRVAFMVIPGFDYVRVQRGIWLAGGVAVPLCTTHPLASLEYVIDDTQASIIVVSPDFEAILGLYAAQQELRFIVLDDSCAESVGELP